MPGLGDGRERESEERKKYEKETAHGCSLKIHRKDVACYVLRTACALQARDVAGNVSTANEKV
jgi:hypothetical protein